MELVVLLADLPPTLEDIVAHLLQARSEIHVVRQAAGKLGLAEAAALVKAALVVVTRADPADLHGVDPALALAADLTVVALSLDGAWGCTHRLRLETLRHDDLNAAQLLAGLATAEPVADNPRSE